MGHTVFRSDKIFRLGALKCKVYRWMAPLALICLYYHETFPPLYILNRIARGKSGPNQTFIIKFESILANVFSERRIFPWR